mmetsp:Transcript_69398/g.185189  ORF Transcript_69398/g.185189 Transcript_69398/m.185189 type:complete len:298 (-) Transcript_69398:73-966(-)
MAVAASQGLEWKAPGNVSTLGTHYILEGEEDKPLVLCIHGIGCFFFFFDGIAQALLEAGYRVLRYDLIGRGYSNDADHYDQEAHLGQLKALLTELGLANTKRIVIGHSMGGAIALLHADQDPEHIESLILLSPAGLMDSFQFKALRGMPCLQGLVSAVLKQGQESAWRRDFYGKDEATEKAIDHVVQRLRLMNANRPGCFHAIFQSVVHFPLSGLEPVAARVGARKGRLLLLWGDHDVVVPVKGFEHWKRTLASEAGGQGMQVEAELVKDGGHSFHLHKGPEVNARILAFLRPSPAI